MRCLRRGTNNGGGRWTLTAAQLAGLTLTAGEVTTATLTITATNTQGAGASTTQSIALTVNPLAPAADGAEQPFGQEEDGTVALGIGETLFDSARRGVGDDCRRTERCDAVGRGRRIATAAGR